MARPSPFLEPGSRTRAGDLALVHLSRDNLLPVILQESEGNHDGYAEGVVLNTRYGSFPHSTLIDVPWGSQIRASAVDTGSRGRKRKRPAGDEESKASTPAEDMRDEDATKPMPAKKAVTASSGFIHVLPPTPELWTMSLPHRTQVVYTPDYSYILQRIRARPGTRLIEAGAGSGSFTHASARAVYNGYPEPACEEKGKVFSFEFHKPRFEKLTEELRIHGLDGLVQLTHRDVCRDGFLVDGESPNAAAVFLDLPAPWDALPQLSRRRPASTAKGQQDGQQTDDGTNSWVSPLDPTRSVYLCTFSPCIEQVTRTVSTMRSLGWVEIEMVEIAHKKLYVSREKVTERAGQAPADVAEAVARLKELEKNAREYHGLTAASSAREPEKADNKMEVDENNGEKEGGQQPGSGKTGGLAKSWLQGPLSHRPEAELKTHTSYLVFAILPREWSEEDEAAALAQWPCGGERKVIGNLPKDVRKEEKRELLKGKKRNKGNDAAPAAPPSPSVPVEEVETS